MRSILIGFAATLFALLVTQASKAGDCRRCGGAAQLNTGYGYSQNLNLNTGYHGGQAFRFQRLDVYSRGAQFNGNGYGGGGLSRRDLELIEIQRQRDFARLSRGRQGFNDGGGNGGGGGFGNRIGGAVRGAISGAITSTISGGRPETGALVGAGLGFLQGGNQGSGFGRQQGGNGFEDLLQGGVEGAIIGGASRGNVGTAALTGAGLRFLRR